MRRVSRNNIVIVIDALRADRVGALTDGNSLTPNIDELAGQGIVFENAFACANATDPSITTIHTGRDPSTVVKHHGSYVTDSEKRRAEKVEKVPAILNSAGITTVATGRLLSRWHKSGFDRYPEQSLNRHRRRAIGEKLETIHPAIRSVAGEIYEWFSEGTTGSETDAIDTFFEMIDVGPFYGFIHLMDTHAPYEHDEELVEELLERGNYPSDDLDRFFERHQENDYLQEFFADHVDEADYEYGVGRLIAKYDAAVVEADKKVGSLVDGLRRRGLFEDTTLIVLSDHGESLDEHGIYFDHHGLYDQSIRVPLIISGPEIRPQRRKEFVQLYDLAPTIVDCFGLEDDIGVEGRSLQPLLHGHAWENREFVAAREAHTQSRIAIRTADWKYIQHVEDPVLEDARGDSFRCGYCHTIHGARRELYNLTEDPGETTNVVDEYLDTAARLEEKLQSYLDGLETPETDAVGQIEYENESAVMERLEDLGYK